MKDETKIRRSRLLRFIIQQANVSPPMDAPSAVAHQRFLRLLGVLVMERPIAPPSVAPKRVRTGLQLGFVAIP